MPGTDASPTTRALYFLRERWLRVTTTSFLLLTPCLWHRRIEAGDLASHAYNAWLAMLVKNGRAPGLWLARQWTNVLFDYVLSLLSATVGFAAAQRIAAGGSVLLFVWRAFAAG